MAASMAASVRVSASAKVNLHLRVYGRRPDGYHGVLSLFQAVSLADGIVVRSLKEPETVDIDGDFDCPPERTTVYKAVQAFRRVTGVRSGVSISVHKQVPAGAGLGGGSGDAAAVLRGLDALFDTGLEAEKLAQAGADIGSDVPFFFAGGTAIVSGRGECVETILPREDFSLAIVFPGFPVSTAMAYALLDEARPDDSGEPDLGREELVSAYAREPSTWPFANSFEPIIGSAFPTIPRLRDRLLGLGSSFVAMTGSGSALFGVFAESELCESACKRLSAEGLFARAAAPLARPTEVN